MEIPIIWENENELHSISINEIVSKDKFFYAMHFKQRVLSNNDTYTIVFDNDNSITCLNIENKCTHIKIISFDNNAIFEYMLYVLNTQYYIHTIIFNDIIKNYIDEKQNSF